GYVDGAMHRYRAINLGVAIDTEAGLVVPVIKDADRLDLVQIARAVREFAVKARERKLMPDELVGATFSISNLGGLGVDWFTPVLNPPQCAILGVGRVRREPRCAGDAFVARDVATLVLTFDHRLVDGAPCARFLGRLRELIEAPGPLLP
ncbi:MAG: 2-oxo acid dehydrogenase subunit E2, partial [Arenicellales bacterium]|nr:2-oxo acid dehydrogenase subunit E2 [Arenicellales bacterium]